MYVDVILPLPLPGTFTYAISEEFKHKTEVGQRVVVPFGKKKHYTGIITRIHNQPSEGITIRPIHSLSDQYPIVTPLQLQFWEWISYYYLCTLGEVCKAALPSFMKPEDLATPYTPKEENYYRINKAIDSSSLQSLLSRAKKQEALFSAISTALTQAGQEEISKQEVKALPYYSAALLRALMEKQILTVNTVQESRLIESQEPIRAPYTLSEAQQLALSQINEQFSSKNTVLLHGVTSSGKTEIYIHLIQQTLNKEMQTVFLLPEIALTTQLTQRLKNVFGNKLGVYHSGINDNDRTEVWKKMLSDTPYEIIIGARSALFLPYQKLGLVIVDEEHETSYKQQNPAPRYHGRDSAIMLAHLSGAKTILGSATPSVESYYNCQMGKYGLVVLSERFNKILMPHIKLINTRDLRKRKKMKSILSPALIEATTDALEKGEQVIFFRNRRGFAPVFECKECAWTPRCNYCDVSLTLHKRRKQLVCHYCDRSYPIPETCPTCESEELKPQGMGTEQIEEESKLLFPSSIVARMDADTTRGKQAYEKLIRSFQEGKINILVGTQMLSKGLDFDHVRVVGILAADALINHPDFRSHERGFQLMIQAAGRSGRKDKQGTVLIQTADPEQSIYRYVTRNDYIGFVNAELIERKLFEYPPFTRLIRITIKHKVESLADSAATHFAQTLRSDLAERVIGPAQPLVSRIKLQYLREILLKIEGGYPPQQVRRQVLKAEQTLHSISAYKYISIGYDVDPV